MWWHPGGEDEHVMVCNALGCPATRPATLLMCSQCWSKLPLPTQLEVLRTANLRNRDVDSSWAPWWRAAAGAIYHAGHALDEDWFTQEATHWLEEELAFAANLEK